MSHPSNGVKQKRVVLVADVADHNTLDLSNSKLEFTDKTELTNMMAALCKSFDRVTHYSHPSLLIENIRKHSNDTVLSIWSGEHSRNRRTLIPSLCEAYGLSYVGADTYVHILCQDKALAHEVCRSHGFITPRFLLIDNETVWSQIRHLDLPLVVKPNFEGGSIGIAKENLLDDYSKVEAYGRHLTTLHHQAIIVEEFIPGREVSLVLFGTQRRIKWCEGIEILINDGQLNLQQRLYSYELKWDPKIKESWKIITAELPEKVIEKACSLFNKFGKVELLRIDGRWDGKRFVCIELSPDVYLGNDSEIATAFSYHGCNYEQMLATLIHNASNNDLSNIT